MLAKLIAWTKFLLAFAFSWIVLAFAVVLVMLSATPSGTTSSPYWTIVLLLLPTVGAFFAGRRFSHRNFDAINAARESTSQRLFAANLAVLDADQRLFAANRAVLDAERWQARQFLHDQVDRHRSALQRNVRNALVKNDYGMMVTDRQEEAVLEFLSSIGFAEGSLSVEEAVAEILADLEGNNRALQAEDFDPTLIPVDGHEFEHWVADSLRKFGWEAEVTAAGGDQGIDVIASKRGLKLGMQCKLSSRAVGNRAIQEVVAGAQHYGLHRAVVLSNASFTKSAMDLAASTNVLLISQYDLPELDRLLREGRYNRQLIGSFSITKP